MCPPARAPPATYFYIWNLDSCRALGTRECPETFLLAVGAVDRGRLTAPARAQIDVLLVSHFHIDHAAAMPYLTERTAFKARAPRALPAAAARSIERRPT
jgi:glyoxylase-like metal-dependent hydrolase (beta-lactamase superfamily II)